MWLMQKVGLMTTENKVGWSILIKYIQPLEFCEDSLDCF